MIYSVQQRFSTKNLKPLQFNLEEQNKKPQQRRDIEQEYEKQFNDILKTGTKHSHVRQFWISKKRYAILLASQTFKFQVACRSTLSLYKIR